MEAMKIVLDISSEKKLLNSVHSTGTCISRILCTTVFDISTIICVSVEGGRVQKTSEGTNG